MDNPAKCAERLRRECFIAASDIRFHVTDEGSTSAIPIIFSHSIMTDASMWDGQIEMLKDNYRIVRYDSRGHGKSDAGVSDYTTGMLADDVIAIADGLRIDKFHFVGLSLGGIVGFDLALNYPGRLISLVICDARADSPEEFARPWDARVDLARQEGMQVLVEPTMARWFGSEFLATDQAEKVRRMIRGTSTAGFVATARALQSYDYQRIADYPATKMTFIVGERDGALPAIMRTQASGIINARFRLIESAGHLPNIENQLAFNEVLSEHLLSSTK